MYDDFATKLATTMWGDYDRTPERETEPPEITDLSTIVVDGNFPWTIVTVATMAGVHVGASMPNFLALEFHARNVPWWDDMIKRSEPLIQDGRISVPDTPRTRDRA